MNYGLQLYSVRDVAEQNYEDALKQVAEIGYTLVETAGLFGNDPEDVAKMLKKYGLTACSTHTGVKELAADLEKQVDLGIRRDLITLHSNPPFPDQS